MSLLTGGVGEGGWEWSNHAVELKEITVQWASENARAERREHQDIPNNFISSSKGAESGKNGNRREADTPDFKNGMCLQLAEYGAKKQLLGVRY